MPKDEERSRNGRDDGSNGELTEALVGVVKGNKELLASAAISAAGAVAASKGPQLVRRLTQATEDRGEHEAERLGKKAAEGAKQGLGGEARIAGRALAKAIGGGSSDGKKTRRLPVQRWTDVAVPVDKAYVEMDDAKGIEYRSRSDQDDQERRQSRGSDPHGDEKRRERRKHREERRRAHA